MTITREQLDDWEIIAEAAESLGVQDCDDVTDMKYYIGHFPPSVVKSLIAALAEAEAERDKARALHLKWMRERPVAPHPIDQMNNLEKFLREDRDDEIAALTSALGKAREALDWIAKFYPGTVPKEKMVEYLIDNYNYNRQRAISALDAINEATGFAHNPKGT
jgi:hypothetical protein